MTQHRELSFSAQAKVLFYHQILTNNHYRNAIRALLRFRIFRRALVRRRAPHGQHRDALILHNSKKMFSKGRTGRHSPCDCFSSRDTISILKKKKPPLDDGSHEPWVLYRYTPEKPVSRESSLFGNETKYVFDLPKVDDHWVEDSSMYEDSSLYQDDADSGCRYSSDCDNSTVTSKSFVLSSPYRAGVAPVNSSVPDHAGCSSSSSSRKKANLHGDLITRWINQLETVEEVDTDFHSPSTTVCALDPELLNNGRLIIEIDDNLPMLYN